MDHSRFLSRLICKLPFQQWETWLTPSSIHLLNYPIAVYISSNIHNVKTYLHVKQLYQLEYSNIQFPYSYRFCSVPKLLRSASFFPSILSEVISYIFNTVGSLYHTSHSILGSLDLQTDSLKFACIKVKSFLYEVLWMFTINIFIYAPLNHHTKYFQHPKRSTVYHMPNFFLFLFFIFILLY